MKYESNVLKRLVDTYGVIGNPKYMSEIIKQFIVQGKECFPHLFTYQADWLAHIDEFGLTSDYVVSYTGQQIYAPHSKEKPVKRAILKGQTLINLYKADTTKTISDGSFYFVNAIPSSMFKSNTYTVINTTNKKISIAIRSMSSNAYIRNIEIDALTKIAVTLSNDEWIRFFIAFASNGWDNGNANDESMLKKMVVIEGDYTNVNIPYFEGMQSVKMSVLTTSNEDGTKTNILTVNEPVELGSVCNVQDELNVLTGEVVKATTKIKLDSTLGWIVSKDYGDGKISFISSNEIYGKNQNDGIVSDKFPTNGNGDSVSLSKTSGRLVITVLTSKISNWNDSDTNDEKLRKFGIYLDSLDAHARYINSEKVVKTVDLTIKDQNNVVVNCLATFKGGTHFYTTSQVGSLKPMIEVDVVTDLAETLNLCSLDGNTM